MFSSEDNTSEAAGVCWCCQLCLMLVTELSAQRCSHLRSWQPTVVSEQQTHFSITPLSLSPPFNLLSSHFIWHSSSVHSSHLLSFLLPSSLLPILSPLLSHLRFPFLHCMILLSAIHPDWTHWQFFLPPSHILTQFSIFSYSLTCSHPFSHCLHVLSPPLTSQQLLFFTVYYLKMCFLQRWQKNIPIKEQDCCSCCRHILLFFKWYYASRWHTDNTSHWNS